jgi:hypothetical protein
VRWCLLPILVLICGEIGARIVIYLDVVEEPFIYGNHHIDVKVSRFQDIFLPMHAGEEAERYLIMGSSMPNTNMDPHRISGSLKDTTGRNWYGFNGAFFAGRFDDMLFFMDWYYDQWQFDHLVMTVEPWGMRPGRFEQLQERLSKPAFEHWLMEHSALFKLRNQWIPWDMEKDERRRGLMALDLDPTAHGWNRTVPHFRATGSSEAFENYARMQAEDMLDRTKTPPTVYTRDELAYDKLEQVQRWAAERGVKVWWVLSPTASPLEKYMLPEFKYPELRKLAEKLASEPDNYVIDMKYLEYQGALPLNMWFDANHMLPNGAALYSEELGKRWGELAKKVNGAAD